MARMPTQLLLTYDFPPMQGGIARWMGELAKNYPGGSLIVSTGQYPDGASVDGQFPNRVDRLPTRHRRLRTAQGLIRWARRAAALARSERTEFTWCGNLKPAAYPARWVAARTGVPYGILVHGGDLLLLRHQIERSALKLRTARILLKSASVLVANSHWTADLCRTVLDTLGLGNLPGRIRVVPLGGDPERFRPGIDPTNVRERYGLDGRRWLITVARLTRHKGVDTGLHVLARLRDRHPDLAYAVVGSGEALPVLEGLAQSLGVADRVRFLSGVPDSDLPGLYNCAEIYLGLSRQTEGNVEGFGISLVEAGACGLPVVGGRSGGIPDAVREGETGLLVDSERPDEVVAAVRELLDNRTLAQRLGTNGRRAVETHYNWKRVADDLARMGRELASVRRPCLQDAR
jgi:phosphatidylinositol alpha-1,6-mannosyltransferase